MSDDNGIDGGNSGDVVTWDGTKWITVPATPITNGVPVTISGGTVTQGGTITVNGTGFTVGNVIANTNNIMTPYITWFNPANNNQQLELDLAEPENKENSEGCTCKKCKELFPYAESPKDGSIFICWGCRHF